MNYSVKQFNAKLIEHLVMTQANKSDNEQTINTSSTSSNETNIDNTSNITSSQNIDSSMNTQIATETNTNIDI